MVEILPKITRLNRLKHRLLSGRTRFLLCLNLACILGISTICYAQDEVERSIQLEVLDRTTDTPVESAVITYSYTAADKKVNKYFRTDEHGKGMLLIPQDLTDEVLLNCNHLEYENAIYSIDFVEVTEDNLTIYMDQRTEEIKEVVIKSYRLGIHDTIHVKFDKSLLSNTNNIIEQLKNDDRFSINSNNIMFKGKTVSKVIVDDVDVTGDNYIGLMEQAKIKTFESMDVIQNYQDNPLNQGFEAPETALRLNTKDKKKISTSLTAEGKVSQIRLNELKLGNYVVGPKAKFFNNVSYGKNDNRLFRPYNYDYNAGNIEGLKAYKTYIDRPSVGVPMDNITKSELLVNAGIPIGRYMLNRTSANVLNMTDHQANQYKTSLSLSDELFDYDEKDYIETSNRYYIIENETKFNKNRTFANLNAHVILPSDSYSNIQTFEGAIDEEKRDAFDMNRSSKADINLTLAQLLSDRVLLEYESNARIIHFNENYINTSVRSGLTFNATGPVTDRLKTDNLILDNSATFKIRLKRGNTLKPKIGVITENRVQILNRSIVVSEADSLVRSDADFRRTDICISMPFGNTHLPRVFRFEISPKVIRTHYSYVNSFSENASDEFLYDLRGKFVVQPRDRIKMRGSAGTVRQLIESDDFKPYGFNSGSFILFQDIIGKPIERYLTSDLNIDISTKGRKFHLELNGKYDYFYDKKQLTTRRDVAQGVSSIAFFTGSRKEAGGKMDLEFKPIRLKMNLDSRLQLYSKEFVLNTELVTSDVLSHINMMRIDFRTRHFTFMYTLMYIRSNNALSTGATFSDYQLSNQLGILHITNNRKWNSGIFGKNMKWSRVANSFSNLNFFVDYGYTRAIHFGLFGENLVGLKQLTQIINAEYEQSINIYDVVPRQIGAYFKWDIF